MPLPIIDWQDHILQELPHPHRTPRWISWLQGCVNGGIGWLNKNFRKYIYGDLVSEFWSNSTVYDLNSFSVTYLGVYVSLVGSNSGNNPDTTTGFWYKISPSYLGAFERGSFNSQKLIYEYALNGYFRTLYRQPTSLEDGTAGIWYLPLSDIYITTELFDYVSFGVTSVGVRNSSVSSRPTIYGLSSISRTFDDITYRFIIWIPTSLSISLGVNYVQIISNTAKLLNIVGTTFTIQVY
jgi:hypothetical protein